MGEVLRDAPVRGRAQRSRHLAANSDRRERDALAAERRRQPMAKIDERYVFEGPRGKASLLDLFALARTHTSLVLVSIAPIEKIEAYRARMGWPVPWYSSAGSAFNRDFGRTTDEGEDFGLSVFVRDDDRNVYRTYFTSGRGVETLGPVWSLLDLTPLGRQEEWEDTPPGRPQTKPYTWWRRHDEYETN